MAPTWDATVPFVAAGETPTASKLQVGYDIDAALTGPWTTYTPTLTASSSDPTLGTGSSVSGRYVQIGKLVWGNFVITFGTSGVDAGSGIYLVSLPVAAVASPSVLGSGYFYDLSAGQATTFVLAYDTSTLVALRYSGGNVITDALPVTSAAGDVISSAFMYEAA